MTNTILPITPPWPSNSCASLASTSGNRRISALEQSVRQAFTRRHDESSSTRYDDPKCLVIESALMFCHKREAGHFFVRELAERVNDLLVGRHADFKVEDRKVGSVLTDLGIHKRRVTKGFRVDLTPEIRSRIHWIANAHQVLSLQADVNYCAECKDQDSVGKV